MSSKPTLVPKRGMIIDINLDPTLGAEKGKIRTCIVVTNDIYNALIPVVQVTPITEWSEKKARVKTNVEIEATTSNGLVKRSIADCLQTRPVDTQQRLIHVRGNVSKAILEKIDLALRIVFDL